MYLVCTDPTLTLFCPWILAPAGPEPAELLTQSVQVLIEQVRGHVQACGAKNRTTGEPCQRSPMMDSTRCRTHGGKSPQSQKAASERRERRYALQQLSLLGEVPTENVDPTAALLELVTQKHAQVHSLRQIVAEVEANAGEVDLGKHPMVWGVSNHEEGVGVHGPIDKTTQQAGINVWLKLLQEAEDQLARYTSVALKAGVEQRQLDITEQQATSLAAAINRILDALQLTPEQQGLIPSVVPDVLRQFAASQPAMN